MRTLLFLLLLLPLCAAPPPGGAGGGSRAFRSNPPAAPAAPASFPSGATHYWNLDEVSGIRDDAVGSIDLDETTTVASGTGKDGNAAQFTWNGTSFGRFDDGGNISIPSEFSISGWFKFSDVSANQKLQIFAITDVTGIAISITYDASTDLISFAHAEEDGPLTFAFTPNTDWRHIAATATGTTVVLYLDGASVASDGGATIDFNLWDSITFFSSNSGAMSGTVGLVDEVAIFDRALTPQEVADIWNGGVGTFGP